jgi:1-aminocyclopropane-1-carboxylate deaminase/D-cysteine desulfhydrase-like pyridoxal-dependent ACC family enzyme
MNFDWLFVSAGSGGTYSGLLIGKKLYQDPVKVVGISPWLQEQQIRIKIQQCITETLAVIKQNVSVSNADILLSDAYIGEGYGIPTPAGMEALHLLARTEAILLDHVYTAKAMAGCLDYIKQGMVKPGERVLFWHTGGAPSLFTF